MKKIVLLMALLLMPGLCMAAVSVPDFKIESIKYDPYPAVPGSYMVLWIEAKNTGTDSAEGVTFDLELEYPFILDPNENATREFGKIPGLYEVILQYRIRVDSTAVYGWNKVKLKYQIGDGTLSQKELDIYISRETRNAELEPIFVSSKPKAYPGGTSILTVDVANIAPGTAYYTIVSAETEVAEIDVNRIFIGTLDADDFDTVDFTLKFKSDIEPGIYPVHITSVYKNEDYIKQTSDGYVYVKVFSQAEALQRFTTETPWYMYVVYLVITLIVLKYFLIPWGKKTVSYFKGRKKSK